MADRRLNYLTALIAALAFYGAYQKWFSWIVLVTVLALPVFSLLVSLIPMFLTRVKMRVPETVRRGSRAKIAVSLRCPGIRPPFFCRIRVTEYMTGNSRILRHGEALPTDHCGALLVVPEKAAVTDYLGLFARKIRHLPVSAVRVMPGEMKPVIPAALEKQTSSAYRPKMGGGYAENHEIREYRPGDSLNLVHWKLSAKSDSLLIREPMEPHGGTILLTLDLCGTPDEIDRKLGRLLALGRYLLERGVPFTAAVLTKNEIHFWEISGEAALLSAMEEILMCPVSTDGATLENVNTQYRGHYHIGGEPDEK